MNSDIYFSHGTRLDTPAISSRKVFNCSCRVASYLFPEQSARLMRVLLSRPSQAARQGQLSSDFERKTLPSESGDLQIYSIGTGPVVLFAHGWSGNAGQFEPLMRQIAEKGYKAVAFDHYRHGLSKGVDSNYFHFITATISVRDYLEKKQEPVTAVIGHSIGGSASLHAFSNCSVPHFLISPVIGVYEMFCERVFSAGIPDSMLDRVVRSMESGSPMSFAALDESQLLQKNTVSVKLVHSTRDRVVDSSRSLGLSRTHPNLDLDVGAYGGHSSILKTEHTKRSVCQWLSEQLC